MSGWSPVSGTEAATLERELARELPTGHVLKTLRVRAIARRFDCDDVAFEVEDGRRCVVHLTWRVDTDPLWPRCVFVKELPERNAEDEDG
ncbi:MAG: hypothetical protein IPG17_32225 [Sandaracinaceae bacterium]|jgi:hypothetical protein|nr:hypothetical protein [Sandaracinaceae bacterium]MBK7774791.1 hypothetical protein [Sandaracinaceae bacterium]MBK8589853.1 hypothetical protein [Sandaracinaceae bacterium]MBP7683499.1 hypothetical protein [Deltaproteobacteria bacterium]